MIRNETVNYLNGPLPSDQQVYDDVRDMIRAMFAVCDLSSEHWNLPDVDSGGMPVNLVGDTRWLREYFLRAVECAMDSDAEPDTLFDDMGQELLGLEYGRDGSEEWCRIEPRFEGRSMDGEYAFSITCTGSDDTAVWLEPEALTDRDDVIRAIAEARQAIKN